MELKNCPYCGGELEAGMLCVTPGSHFAPEHQETPKWRSRKNLKKKGHIFLIPNSLGWEMPPAYTCRACKVLVVPYEEYE